jgi:hypothetical protein
MRITEKRLRRIIRQELQESRLSEATVKLDTFNLQEPKLQRFIRDRGIDYDVLGQENPGIDFVKYFGDRRDLENMIDKFWGGPMSGGTGHLKDMIEE